MEGTLANVTIFAGNFAPRTWAYCQGQLLTINSNTALFSLIGTIYGGDGRTTFGLPDLQGRHPISSGHGPGLQTYPLGARGGIEYNYLTASQLPSHTHAVVQQPIVTTVSVPTYTGGDIVNESGNGGSGLAEGGTAKAIYAEGGSTSGSLPVFTATTSGGQVSVMAAGASQAVLNLSPYLAMNYIICTQGNVPSRN